jgi:hypothetical protein
VKSDELIVISVWALTVATAGVCIGKLLWRDAGHSEAPLGIRFAFSFAAFLPSSISLVDALLHLPPSGNSGDTPSNLTFVLLLFLNFPRRPGRCVRRNISSVLEIGGATAHYVRIGRIGVSGGSGGDVVLRLKHLISICEPRPNMRLSGSAVNKLPVVMLRHAAQLGH